MTEIKEFPPYNNEAGFHRLLRHYTFYNDEIVALFTWRIFMQ
jgi:hypothetical protein